MKFKLAIAVFAFLPALVLAQNAPNMIGTWITTSNAAVIGSAAHNHHPDKKDKEIYFNKVQFTYVIDRQEGLNFSGSLSSSRLEEVIVGAIMPDFQGGVMTDEDGTHAFKFIDATTIQNCYVQIIANSKVAGCSIVKKQ